MKRNTIFVSLIVVAALVAGCAQRKLQTPPRQTTARLAKTPAPETPPIVPLNPKVIEAELLVTISDIQVLNGNRLRQDNRKRGIPQNSPPQLYVWSSGITARQNQRVVEMGLTGPAPEDIYTEKENGNQIYFWNLNDEIMNQRDIVIRRQVKIESYELYNLVQSDLSTAYDPMDPTYQFYTKSELFQELTRNIRAKAAEIIGSERDPYYKAERIFNWVASNMRFQYPPQFRGASAALGSLSGDSGQYADLFVALSRAVGVPSRLVAGFKSNNNETLKNHIWAEFYILRNGWVQVDPTQGPNQFGHLRSPRLVASVGRNIELKNAPHWATFSNSEVEDSRTGFMQVATLAFCGIKAKFRTKINTLSIQDGGQKLFSNQEE